MKILSVDWDFFFADLSHHPIYWGLYDWGHSETNPFFLHELWYGRAIGFLIHDLPLPGTTGEEVGFWDRFKFSRNCKLYLADSHSQIYHPKVRRKGVFIEKIVNYDAHHDGGYKTTLKKFMDEGKVYCHNWAIVYETLGAQIETVYPRWKEWAFDIEGEPVVEIERHFDTGEPRSETFDAIFMCRSGSWTPPWIDKQFSAFIEAAPVKRKVILSNVEPRDWSDERVQIELAQQREFRATQRDLLTGRRDFA